MNKEKIGAFILENRKALGLTQEELAQKLFVTNKAVSKWEKGQSFPDIAMFEPLAAELGITVSELIAGEREVPAETTVKVLAKEVINIELKKDIIAAIHWIGPVLIFIIGFAVCFFVQKPDIELMERDLAYSENKIKFDFRYFVENNDPEDFTLEEWKEAYEAVSYLVADCSTQFYLTMDFSFAYDTRYSGSYLDDDFSYRTRYPETDLEDDLKLLQDEIFIIIRTGEATPKQKEIYKTFTENIKETFDNFTCFNRYNEVYE